jgi:hypothetical protein
MRRLIFCTALTFSVALFGCSAPRSNVFGNVTFRGKPVVGGTIILLSADNRTYPARIQADGSYRIASVPRGHIAVAVQGDEVRPPPRPAPGAKTKDAFGFNEAKADDERKAGSAPPSPTTGPVLKIPASYGDPGRSGLSFELELPEQEYSIDLK